MKCAILFVGSLLFGLFVFSEAQNVQCSIPWRFVNENRFRVVWNLNPRCDSYNLIVLDGYTNSNIERLRVTGLNVGSRTIRDNLTPRAFYGARVECVRGGDITIGRPCRTRLLGRGPPKPTNPPRGDVPVGSCGQGRFTCDSGQCIRGELWCNVYKDCDDGTDERGCAGSCPDINFHYGGNMTCGRFFSPSSACYFECNEGNGWKLEGARYTYCKNQQWTRTIPTCRVEILDGEAIRFSDTAVDLSIQLSPNTLRYEIQSIVDGDSGTELNIDRFTLGPPEVSRMSEEGRIVTRRLSGFPRAGSYVVSLVPIDVDGNEGILREFFADTVDYYSY